LAEFLRLERKRVPGRILSEADRLECLFFGFVNVSIDHKALGPECTMRQKPQRRQLGIASFVLFFISASPSLQVSGASHFKRGAQHT
jgi:hypothetical protein